MLGSVCFGAAAIVGWELWRGYTLAGLLNLPTDVTVYVLGAAILLASFIMHMIGYRHSLSRKRDRNTLEKTARDKHIELSR